MITELRTIPWSKWSAEEKRKIIEDYTQNGLSLKALARRYHHDWQALRDFLLSVGVSVSLANPRPPRQARHERRWTPELKTLLDMIISEGYSVDYALSYIHLLNRRKRGICDVDMLDSGEAKAYAEAKACKRRHPQGTGENSPCTLA